MSYTLRILTGFEVGFFLLKPVIKSSKEGTCFLIKSDKLENVRRFPKHDSHWYIIILSTNFTYIIKKLYSFDLSPGPSC